jgi:hypothetical protein
LLLCVFVEIVTVVVEAINPGVIADGAKVQVEFWGRPVQLNCTDVLYPPTGISEMVAEPVLPCCMVMLAVLEVRLKVEVPVIVTLTGLEVEVGKKVFPAKTAWIESVPTGRLVTATTADPEELTAALPIAVPLEEKLTIPEIVPWDAVTRAVKVTAVPAAAVASEEESVVPVLMAETLTVVAAELIDE